MAPDEIDARRPLLHQPAILLLPTWALFMTAALAMTACVVPMPIEEEPVEVNWPPFTRGRPDPPVTQIVRYDPETEPPVKAFTIPAVDDPNLDDRIFWRGFLNYSQFNAGVVRFGPPLGIGPESRSNPIEFSLNMCDELRTRDDAGGFFTNRVEILVADRLFLFTDEEPPDTTTPNQELPAEAGSFRVVWFVEFVNDCPEEP